MRRIYNRILGHPIVYDRIRPLVVGGIDIGRVYSSLGVNNSDVVLDVGCGLGEALKHLTTFSRFVGIDVDPIAIKCAQERYRDVPNVFFKCGYLTANDVMRYEPTCSILSGVLHHLDDKTAVEILTLIRQSPRLNRVVTSDIVYLAGEFISNLFAWFDRGRYCRPPEHYRQLAKNAGFNVASSEIISCNPNGGLAKYFVMILSPGARVPSDQNH